MPLLLLLPLPLVLAWCNGQNVLELRTYQGTSQIIRSLVGPEDGEDDDQDELSLSCDSCETADDPHLEDQLSASATAGQVEVGQAS